MGHADPQTQIKGGVNAMRQSNRPQKLMAVFAFVLFGMAAVTASAQEYPNRSITMVVGFPAGGGNDVLARIIADKLSASLGQQVIVDNRGGAGGLIAARGVARATPDGYTLLFGHTGVTSINPGLYANAGYDPRKDFAPIGLLASMPIGLIAHPSYPPKSVAEMIALFKREPGKHNLGVSALGTGSYMCGELFKSMTGTDVALVPYKGTAALANDLMGGHVPVVFTVLPPVIGNIQAGNLRALAVTSLTRLSLLPNVPTAAESGLPGFEAVLHYGLLAPPGTPRPIVTKLNAALRAVVGTDDVKKRINAEGGDPLTSTPEEYAADIDQEERKWNALIKKLNLKVE
jgi:tripartite-type tricarboxylate transporter receptor subunit TctC